MRLVSVHAPLGRVCMTLVVCAALSASSLHRASVKAEESGMIWEGNPELYGLILVKNSPTRSQLAKFNTHGGNVTLIGSHVASQLVAVGDLGVISPKVSLLSRMIFIFG